MIDVRVADQAIQMEKSRPSEPGMDKTAKESNKQVPPSPSPPTESFELTSGHVGKRNRPKNVIEAKSSYPPKQTPKAGWTELHPR
jgi:hypothetical protein